MAASLRGQKSPSTEAGESKALEAVTRLEPGEDTVDREGLVRAVVNCKCVN